jgi:hypothetical protein
MDFLSLFAVFNVLFAISDILMLPNPSTPE